MPDVTGVGLRVGDVAASTLWPGFGDFDVPGGGGDHPGGCSSGNSGGQRRRGGRVRPESGMGVVSTPGSGLPGAATD